MEYEIERELEQQLDPGDDEEVYVKIWSETMS